MDVDSLSSLLSFADETDSELPSMIWLGWNPASVAAFMSKYMAVEWHVHAIDPPFELHTCTNASHFQAQLVAYIASKVPGVTNYKDRTLICADAAAVFELAEELRRLPQEPWVQSVLGQGPPLSGKVAEMCMGFYGKIKHVFKYEHILFE